MKIVAEIVAAIIILVSGVYVTPKVVSELRVETLKKIDRGLPSLEGFARKLTDRK